VFFTAEKDLGCFVGEKFEEGDKWDPRVSCFGPWRKRDGKKEISERKVWKG
jgi:hypothetical protein